VKHWFQLRLVSASGVKLPEVEVKAENPTAALESARVQVGDLSAVPDYRNIYCFRVEACGSWDTLANEEYPAECVPPWPRYQGKGEWNRGANGY
jgi:hypothetical protein